MSNIIIKNVKKFLLDLELLWYKRGFPPDYTYVVARILTNRNLTDKREISLLSTVI